MKSNEMEHKVKNKFYMNDQTLITTERKIIFQQSHIAWKSQKMSHLNCWILAFSTNFCPIKTDLSGNTVWLQASGFQKLAKMNLFWHF